MNAFGVAFNNARRAGKNVFVFNGKLYTTKLKDPSNTKQHTSKNPDDLPLSGNLGTADVTEYKLLGAQRPYIGNMNPNADYPNSENLPQENMSNYNLGEAMVTVPRRPRSMYLQQKYIYDAPALPSQVEAYQQGGSLKQGQEQQMQQAFLQYLMEKTGAKDEQQLQQVIQQLGEKGLKQAYAQFVQEMQQAQVQSAKFGAKFTYISSLRGKCPDGTQLQYYKVGGRLCKKCIQTEQQGGNVEKEDPIKSFRCGRKMKKRN